MGQVLKSVLLLSCVGGMLTGILLLLKPLTKRTFSPWWQYCMWLCVLAVMLLPVRFDLPIRAVSVPQTQIVHAVSEDTVAQAAISSDPVAQNQVQPVVKPPTPRFVPYLLAVLPALWLLGALLSLFLSILQYLRFLYTIRKHSRPIECPELAEVKAELFIRRAVHVRSTNCTTTPLTVGLFRPTLLLPNRAMEACGLRDILRHELTHVKRCDIACKWFALLVRSVHWFNPFVYLACKEMDEACEISCDLAVTDGMDELEKRDYMRTILSLSSSQKAMRLAPSMAGSKVQIERRFTMIQTAKKTSRFVSVLSVIAAIALLSTSVFAGGVVAGAVGSAPSEKTVIEVYNDTTKLNFTNKPYIENYEVYLPLRETLSQFGITDIQWTDGKIDIVLPLLDVHEGFRLQEPSCQIAIGSIRIQYPSDEGKVSYRNGVPDPTAEKGYPMRYAPTVKDGVVYATVEFFENLIFHGQLPKFQVHLIQSSDPKDYYTTDEEVFVGTGEEQNAYHPVDGKGNKRYIKRIVTNEKGEAMLVVTAENQRPEVIAAAPAVNTSHMEGFSRVTSYSSIETAYGELVRLSSGLFIYERVSENKFTDIAYIPPTLQINCYAYNGSAFIA